eukprot:3863667-Rhodomonas_salina.1
MSPFSRYLARQDRVILVSALAEYIPGQCRPRRSGTLLVSSTRAKTAPPRQHFEDHTPASAPGTLQASCFSALRGKNAVPNGPDTVPNGPGWVPKGTDRARKGTRWWARALRSA